MAAQGTEHLVRSHASLHTVLSTHTSDHTVPALNPRCVEASLGPDHTVPSQGLTLTYLLTYLRMHHTPETESPSRQSVVQRIAGVTWPGLNPPSAGLVEQHGMVQCRQTREATLPSRLRVQREYTPVLTYLILLLRARRGRHTSTLLHMLALAASLQPGKQAARTFVHQKLANNLQPLLLLLAC